MKYRQAQQGSVDRVAQPALELLAAPRAVSRSSNRFTLIERLVVVVIIAILVSMLLPALQSAREAGRDAVCRANLAQLGLGMTQYASDYDEWIPTAMGYAAPTLWADSWPERIEEYVGEDCPAGTHSSAAPPPGVWGDPGGERQYFGGSQGTMYGLNYYKFSFSGEARYRWSRCLETTMLLADADTENYAAIYYDNGSVGYWYYWQKTPVFSPLTSTRVKLAPSSSYTRTV